MDQSDTEYLNCLTGTLIIIKMNPCAIPAMTDHMTILNMLYKKTHWSEPSMTIVTLHG